MGLHTGEPRRHEDGYVGMDVHRAARVAACAHGGQVLVSEATYGIALAEAIDFLDLGWHRLKDIPEPEHLYQIAAQGLPRDFPPPKSLGTRATLPIPPTPIVGRDRELAELQTLIKADDVRLVTLTGPGGCGKTRLAIEAAASLEHEFPGGVYFVGLEEVTSQEVTWTTIAEVLGAGSDGMARASLLSQLADRCALLVLDNVEQLPGAADVVAEILGAAPAGAVLTTSRRPLHLAEEYEHPVPPLTLPAAEDETDSGAVRLFLQRAQMVQPGFALTNDNRAAVAEICRRLDGLPLAIELAAARVNLISPRALLARLDASLELPAVRPGRPARQQTLRATIAWSYALLTTDQQAVFRRLGVFAGGCDLAAFGAVMDVDAEPLELLSDLLDVSLVRVGEDADGEPRVHILQTIAGFAREQLVVAGELTQVHQRHAEHYLSAMAELSPLLHSSRFLIIRDRIENELDNVRAALAWSLDADGAGGPSEDKIGLGLRLCQEMNWFWYACGYHSEGRRWLTGAVEAAAGQESTELMIALHGLGVALLQNGENAQARDALLTTLDFWRRRDDSAKIAMELNSLACAYRALGESDTARTLFEESISMARLAGDDGRRAAALSNLAILEVDEDRPDRAVELLQETLEIDKRLGDPWGLAHDHSNLAVALLRAGRHLEARELLRTNAAAAVGLGDVELSINVLEAFCAVFAELGAAQRSARMLGATTSLRAFNELPIAAPDAELIDASISKVRDLPDPQTWAVNLQKGAGYILDDALADALADP